MITITSTPNDFSTACNPLVWEFSSDQTTQPNFRYEVDFFVNSSLHSTHQTFIGRFDGQEILEAIVKSDLEFTGSVTEVFTDSTATYRIRVHEVYGNPPVRQDDEFSAIFTTINGALRPKEWRDFMPELYVLQNDNLSVQRKFLTRFPDTEKRFIGLNETAHLGLNVRLGSNELIFVTVWLYDATGNLIISQPLQLTQFRSILINVSPRVIIANSTITINEFEACAYYEVRATLFTVAFPFILTPKGRTEDLRFYIDRDCERYPWVRLHWLNKLGGFDEFSFKLDTKEESDITIFDKDYLHYTKSAIDRLTLNSDWINERIQNWLVRELEESPQVYLEVVNTAEIETCECVRIVAVIGGNTVFYRPIETETGYAFDGYLLDCGENGWQVTSDESPSECTNEYARVTYTFEGVEYTVDIPRVGVFEGENYYYLINEYEGFDLTFMSSIWNLTTPQGTATSESLTSGWSSSEGLMDISVQLVVLPNECIVVVIDGIDNELQKSGILNGKNYYLKQNELNKFVIEFISDKWRLVNTFTSPSTIYHLLSTPDPPISNDWVYVSGTELESVSTTLCDCGSTPILATLDAGCDCPIGNYSVTEDSPWSTFIVQPCEPADYHVEYERIKVTNTTYELKNRKRNGLMREQVTAQRGYNYRSQLS